MPKFSDAFSLFLNPIFIFIIDYPGLYIVLRYPGFGLKIVVPGENKGICVSFCL